MILLNFPTTNNEVEYEALVAEHMIISNKVLSFVQLFPLIDFFDV